MRKLSIGIGHIIGSQQYRIPFKIKILKMIEKTHNSLGATREMLRSADLTFSVFTVWGPREP